MTSDNPKLPIRSGLLPLIGVLPAGLLGLGIMALHGASRNMILINSVALALGFVSGHWGGRALVSAAQKRPHVFASVILVLMSLTFFDAGFDGVHRWFRVGPLRLHPAAMSIPLLLWILVVLLEKKRLSSALLIFSGAMALHVAQPDAGQATALAAGGLVLAAIIDESIGIRIALAGMGLVGAGFSWMRPDPLAPVPMVEDIVSVAFAMNRGLGIAAVLALTLLPLSAVLFGRQFKPRSMPTIYGFVLGAYLLASIVVVGVGEFPTPVLGFGASPILGAIWGLALLGRVAREPESK